MSDTSGISAEDREQLVAIKFGQLGDAWLTEDKIDSIFEKGYERFMEKRRKGSGQPAPETEQREVQQQPQGKYSFFDLLMKK